MSSLVTSVSVDETLLPRYMNSSSNFNVEMAPSRSKHMYSIFLPYRSVSPIYLLTAFTWRLMPPAAGSRLFNRASAWVGVFVRRAMLSA